MKQIYIASILLLLSGCISDGVRFESKTTLITLPHKVSELNVTYQYKQNKQNLPVNRLEGAKYSFTIPSIRFGGLFLMASAPENEEYLIFKDGNNELQTISLQQYRKLPKNNNGLVYLTTIEK